MSSQLETLEPQLKRVVITGMGIVSCLGNTLDDVADSLYHARSGIKHMPKYAEIGMKSQVAGRPELDLNDKETIGKIIVVSDGNATLAGMNMFVVIQAVATNVRQCASEFIFVKRTRCLR